MTPTSEDRMDLAYRKLQAYFNYGWEWSMEMWTVWCPRPPELEDWECKFLAIEFPLRWTTIRAAFPYLGQPQSDLIH